MKEDWKPIEGYEGLYDLRSDGLLHCLSKHRKVEYTYGGCNYGGYLQVGLSKNSTQTIKLIHRLVYETFVGPIPKGYEIHHKNGNIKDNRLENLCLIKKEEHWKIHSKDRSESMHKLGKENAKPVLQYTLDGEFVAEYSSASEASIQTGINVSNICSCCNSRKSKNERGYEYTTKTAGRFKWVFKDDYIKKIIEDPMAYNDMSMCGITATQLSEYENGRREKGILPKEQG